MTADTVFADDSERGTLRARPQGRRGAGLRLAWLGAAITALILAAAALFAADQRMSLQRAWLDAEAREARALLERLKTPADIAALAAGQAGVPPEQHRWLALCVAGAARALALSPRWGESACPVPGSDRQARAGAVAVSTTATGSNATAGWHVVWLRTDEGAQAATGLVFDAAPRLRALHDAASASPGWLTWVAAACLLAALALGGAQFAAVRRLHALSSNPAKGTAAVLSRLGESALVGREIAQAADTFAATLANQGDGVQRTAEILGLMRKTWQQCADAVLLVDNGGCIVYCNAAGQALLRDPGDRVMGLQVDKVLPGLGTSQLRERALARAPGQGADEPDETVMICRRSGELIDLDIRASLVSIDGEPVFLIMARRHGSTDAPAAAATAPRPDATTLAANPLIATISHELRTPLNGIIGMTDLLGRTSLGTDQRELLDALRTSTQQLRSLLNDILDLAKVESGRLQLDFVALDLVERAARCLNGFRAAARAKGVTLDFRPAVPSLHASADPMRVTQILNNLVDNALKFTPPGGRVVVTLDVEPAGSEAADLRAVFTVRDTGVGIAPDKLPTIFEPFRQAEDSTAREFGGTGLGLSLCRRLSRAMNGDIDVRSTPGAGTTFRVWLDLRRAATSADFADTQPMENANDDALLRGRRVLVADDNTISQKLLTRWLEQEGVIVELATNGAEAVRRAQQGGLDMILMDLSMPVMDGFDATRFIRRMASGAEPGQGRTASEVPIIGVTARAMPGDQDACLRSGMDGYVTKPIKRHELIRTMASAVRTDEPEATSAKSPKTPAS
jgi:signal transduction histidine kinase/AmiR/NasT family two-component response regulator